MSISSIDPVAPTQPLGSALNFTSLSSNPSSQNTEGDSGLQKLVSDLLQNLAKAIQPEESGKSTADGGAPQTSGASGSDKAGESSGGQGGDDTLLALLKALLPLLQAVVEDKDKMSANDGADKVSGQLNAGMQGA